MNIKKVSTVLLLMLVALGFNLNGQDFNGTWSGKMEVGPRSMTIEFDIQQNDEGVAITWASPDEGAYGLPATATISGNDLNVDIPTSGASYKGTLKGETLEGTFSQRGMNFTLNMTRKVAGSDEQPLRPQEAAIEADANKPYHSEEVTFTNGNITLAGTLSMPNTGSRFPAVVLVHGTGNHDRDENIFGHKPFLLLADELCRNGFAVLRYDKRGAGASSPGSPEDTNVQLAEDALAALRYLKTRPEVNAEQVGILGHSEGGSIAIMNAAAHPDEVAFIISMAGPAINGVDMMVEQNRLLMLTQGYEMPAAVAQQLKEMFTLVATSEDIPALRETLKNQMLPQTQIEQLTSPAYRRLLQYDPAKDLQRVKCPMLAINGTLDFQVSCDMNLSAIEKLVPHATVKRYEGLNHLFQTTSDWQGISSYNTITETIAPAVLKDITTWLKSIIKK